MSSQPTRVPEQEPAPTGGLAAIRSEIDVIDREIVALLARRSECVRGLLAHKRTLGVVRVPWRERQVLAKVRAIAEDTGAEPEVVERVFRAMIAAFVELELREQAPGAQRT